MIDGVLIRDALVDTGSAYSMVSSALYDRLPTRPAINSFENSAPDIIVVAGASAQVRGYVVVLLLIAGFEVAHPLLVVSELPFAKLIGMDVFRPHAASFSVCGSTSLPLGTSVCPVCLERRPETKRESRKAPAVVCAVDANRMPKLPLLPPRLAFCAVVSVIPFVEPRGDAGALVTAAYSIAASADTSDGATSATIADNSANCVNVRVTCCAESPFAARAVAPAAVRICRVECRPHAVTVECRPIAVTVGCRFRSTATVACTRL